MACRPRPDPRDRTCALPDRRRRRADRRRGGAAAGHRGGRAAGAGSGRPRRLLDHAAEAKPDDQRVLDRLGPASARLHERAQPVRRACRRAGHGPVGGGVDRAARGADPDRRSGVQAGLDPAGPGGRHRPHAGEPGCHPRCDHGRGCDDGICTQVGPRRRPQDGGAGQRPRSRRRPLAGRRVAAGSRGGSGVQRRRSLPPDRRPRRVSRLLAPRPSS